MATPALPEGLRLESLAVGAAPLAQLFLQRLGLPELFERHLPPLAGRPPALPSAAVLSVLLTNLLLARQPLYALAEWAGRRVPEHIGLEPGQAALLNDDRVGRALDHLRKADRASLLTAVVMQAVRVFGIDLSEFHQDTTTVTFSGDYAHQDPDQTDRPPWITFGYNKDHRPDLKQLLYSVTITADGAVPVHCKTYDGNTTDDQVHIDTWDFLRQLLGHGDFLYVGDSKLCTRDNMNHIAAGQGRFLTVMPRTRAEDGFFRTYLQDHPLSWREVHRQPHPRHRDGPDIVYHGVENPQRSVEGYRVLWYRSSQKQEQDQQDRQRRLRRAQARLEGLQAPGRRQPPRTPREARQAAERILAEERVGTLLRVAVDQEVEETYRQVGPGRPGPDTEYRRVQTGHYRARFEEDGAALLREALGDGLFPLMTNDETLSLADALAKYKYQPFVEKRHEQLKSGFAVAPMWLKSAARVESMLWLYFVVELLAALVEREVRRQMEQRGAASLALYPEGRASAAPTASLVFDALEGLRRHRLLSEQGQELRRFHDPMTAAAQEMLALLGVDRIAYGLD
ncbi:MAG: IS1634 family transposase [Gemmataceae bacterium]|nr:IS1634 family transposase [Gemmataceae bacterium]